MGNSKSKAKSYFSKKFFTKSNEHVEHVGNILPLQPQQQSNEEYEDYEVVIENNLRYQLSNNDNDDIDRQHSNHFLRRFVYGNNFSTPIESKLVQGCKVLDVGCGPGTWLLDLANQFQNSFFYGVDLKPIFPFEIKPGNLQFSEANVLNGLPFPNNEFDFVHQEIMTLSIEKAKWNHVISELVRVTKPGGYIELVEYTSTNNNGPILDGIYKRHKDLCLLRGVDVDIIPSLDIMIESQEYIENVYKDERTIVIGPNGGKVGMIIQDIFTAFNTSKLALEEISYIERIPKEDLTKVVTDLHNELKETAPELKICRFWAKVEEKDEKVKEKDDEGRNDDEYNINDILYYV